MEGGDRSARGGDPRGAHHADSARRNSRAVPCSVERRLSVAWRVRFDVGAEQDLERARDWYEANRGTGTGDALGEAVFAVADLIGERPLSFARWLVDLRYRRALVPGYPYVIVFLVDEPTSTIDVLAVAHTSREPGYWK